MSLLLLIDGYNVVAPIAPPRSPLQSGNRSSDDGWLQRERMQLIQRLATHLSDDLCPRTCVVFDAANPPRDRPHQFRISGIDVRFAVGYPEADDLLEELIASHSAPKQLAVVSSDHRVQAAARRRNCAVFDAQPWLDDLLEGRVRLAARARGGGRGRGAGQGGGEQGGDERRGGKQGPSDSDATDRRGDLDGEQVDRWLREFGF